jgi:hypothetical protein
VCVDIVARQAKRRRCSDHCGRNEQRTITVGGGNRYLSVVVVLVEEQREREREREREKNRERKKGKRERLEEASFI